MNKIMLLFFLLLPTLLSAQSPSLQTTPTTTKIQSESPTSLAKKTSVAKTNTNAKSQQSIPTTQQTPIKTNLISGRHEIPIQSTLPLKGEVAILGKQIFDGMSLFFNKLKQELQQIPFFYALNVLNDDADIKTMRKNIHELKKKSPLFLSLLGSEVLDIFFKEKKSKLFALFPFDGNSKFRSSTYTNAIFFRASHLDEIKALINYAVYTLNEKKFAVFYEASEWGEDVVMSIKQVLEKYNIKLITQASYQQQTINVSQAATTIAKEAPDAIICIAQSRPTYHFIRQIINKGLYKTTFLGLSNLITIQKHLKILAAFNS